MPYGKPTPILLVANPTIRRAGLWSHMPDVRVRAYGHREFAVGRHLSPDVPLLIYQMDRRYADTLHLLDRVSATQSDLCIILVGKELGADRVAQLLRHGAFDYITWPCTADRLTESIQSGMMNRRTFLEVQHLSDELARTNQALAHDRDILTQCNRNLSVLNQLTQTLAGSLEPEAIVKTLFAGLPRLLPADALGLVRTNPEHIWTWSHAQQPQREARVRMHLTSRLAPTQGKTTGTPPRLRLVGAPHLTLVSEKSGSEPDSETSIGTMYDVPLTIGPHGLGLLHVERDGERPFTEQEQQLLTTVGASLALTLRNADTHQHLQDLALRDPLTGVLNRRALDGPLTRELRAGLRYGAPASLLLLDLDYFKTVNDVLGHVAGDDVLKKVATLVHETVRDVDSVGRYGGEEFAVILPHTHLEQAQTLAERIRSVIERHAFDLEDSHVRLTASIGVASSGAADIATIADWISAADAALYSAKAQGRNRVMVHNPGSYAPALTAALCVAA